MLLTRLEPLLRRLKPSSPEWRQERREKLALDSVARHGRGNVRFQNGHVLLEPELRQRKQKVTARLRARRAT
jgi:hypothetical protein